MLKTKRVLGFLLYLNVQTFYLKSIHGRGFIRCPDLDNYLRAELPLLDLSLNSRLLCGAMCTEHLYEWCLSYAWSRDSKRCILFQKKCSIDTQRDQTEKGWEHYETQVMWDIAVGKQAQQSSTHPPFVAELAVDGNRSTDIYDNSCSQTNQPQNSWWRVDLQAVYHIIRVRLLNRGMDKFGQDLSGRLRNVTVTVGRTEFSLNTTCGFFSGPGTLSQLVVIDCPPVTSGRYVKVSILGGYLTLCEVDVFGFNA